MQQLPHDQFNLCSYHYVFFYLVLQGLHKDCSLLVYKSAVPQLALEELPSFQLAFKAAWVHLVPHLSQWYDHHEDDNAERKRRLHDSHQLKKLFKHLVKVAVRDAPVRKKFLEHPGPLYKHRFFKSQAFTEYANSDEVEACLEAIANPV